jgi:hypothetical protein
MKRLLVLLLIVVALAGCALISEDVRTVPIDKDSGLISPK